MTRLLLLTATVLAYALSPAAMAAEYKVGSPVIEGPWSRATPKGSQTAIGYMTIRNNGTTPDRLIGGSNDMAARFELHSMVMEDGIAKMRDLNGIDIAPGQTIEFKPGSSHAMFVDLKHPLSKGERVKGTLVFERAGRVQIEYDVAGIGAQRAPMEMDHVQH